MVRGHNLRQDVGRLGVPGHRDRPVLAESGGLGGRRPHAHRARHRRAGHGHREPPPAGGCGIPLRPRRPVHLRSLRRLLQDQRDQAVSRAYRVCYDNAVSESFFATYKKELVHTRPWPTQADLTSQSGDWIENYYNTTRRHSTLGYLTPREYELGYRYLSQL